MVLAREKVLYHGFPVAAVAATSLHAAEEALDLIDVEYEVLEPVLTLEDAMKDDAVLLARPQGSLLVERYGHPYYNVYRPDLVDVAEGLSRDP